MMLATCCFVLNAVGSGRRSDGPENLDVTQFLVFTHCLVLPSVGATGREN